MCVCVCVFYIHTLAFEDDSNGRTASTETRNVRTSVAADVK